MSSKTAAGSSALKVFIASATEPASEGAKPQVCRASFSVQQIALSSSTTSMCSFVFLRDIYLGTNKLGLIICAEFVNKKDASFHAADLSAPILKITQHFSVTVGICGDFCAAPALHRPTCGGVRT